MRTIRTIVAAGAASAIGLLGAVTVAQAEPITDELTVLCDGIGDDTITVTGDLGEGGTAELPADGPLTVVGEPGFTGTTSDGTAVEVEPTGEGVTCTAQTSTDGDLDELVPDQQAEKAATSADAPVETDTPVTGRLTFTVSVDEKSVNAAAAQQATAVSDLTMPFAAELRSYLANRPGAVGVSVRLPGSDDVFSYTKTSNRNVTASIVKTEIMAAVMLKAQDAGRGLTAWEKSKIVPMIRQSDNAATTALYTHIGRKNGLTRVSQRLGMTGTISDPADHWGLTSTVPRDQARLMEHFYRATGVLSATNRSYGMTQMKNVVSSQDWGVSAGPPAGTVALKNGWLPRTDGWHVNSIGASTYGAYDYMIGVLTHDSSSSGTQSRQVSTIEGVSRIVHRNRVSLFEAAARQRLVRRAGADAYETSAMISAAAFSPGRPVAYVTTGENVTDALAAAPLAARRTAPLLLTRKGALPDSVSRELTRLRPTDIVVVGGPLAVSDGVVATLRRYATSGKVTRLAGATRYDTSALVSRSSYPSGASTVILVPAAAWALGLPVPPAARKIGAPVLMTASGGLSTSVQEEIARLRPSRIVVIGGESSISRAAVADAQAVAPGATAERWLGSNRYATAAAISRKSGLSSSFRAYVATGENFPDALAVAPLAALRGSPVLLSAKNYAPSETVSALRAQPLTELTVVGGPLGISSLAAHQLSLTVD